MSQVAIDDRTAQYVTLGIDMEVFAVEVDHVHEILDLRPISRVPNAPNFLVGMIDVRHRTVPVIDLRVKLGLPAAPAEPTTRIIVLDIPINQRMVVMGLVVDRVYEVTTLSDQAMEEAPDIGVRWHSQYIKAVARRGPSFVIVLDLVHLFSAEERSLVAVPEAATEAQ